MNLKGKKIILGSNSPRRRELLSGLGLDFTVDTCNNFVESMEEGVAPEQVPVLMAQGKSQGFHRALDKDEILITADTVVIVGENVLGKPSDSASAARMLRLLSGTVHKVVTAVTVRDREHSETVSDTSEVHFKKLTNQEIDYYIENYHPYDKAGAYGIQEWIGYIGITEIKGSFYNIMGFPVHKVYEEIIKFVN